jgi:thioredoxin reductase
VTGVAATDDGFRVTTHDGEYAARSLVLTTGADRTLADALGCTFEGDVVDVDVRMETSVDDAFASGAMVREAEWQAMLSAGAAAALNLLSKTKGEHFHDFDTPDERRRCSTAGNPAAGPRAGIESKPIQRSRGTVRLRTDWS